MVVTVVVVVAACVVVVVVGACVVVGAAVCWVVAAGAADVVVGADVVDVAAAVVDLLPPLLLAMEITMISNMIPPRMNGHFFRFFGVCGGGIGPHCGTGGGPCCVINVPFLAVRSIMHRRPRNG